MTKPFPFLDLKAQFASIRDEILEAVHRNLESQLFILGPEVDAFEKEISAPKDAEIIVYCSSDTCTASVISAEQLETAGYTNVVHYKDGLAGWKNAGYAFEGKA